MKKHRSNLTSKTFVSAALSSVIALILSACGGGGSGGHDLAVGFTYASGPTDLFAATQTMPKFTGLEGNAPRCRLVSGVLAPGVTLGGDCSISGAGLKTGVFESTIELTVDGFDGSISTSLQLVVNTPTLTAIRTSNLDGAPNQVVQVGASVQGLPVATLRNYSTQSGDVIQYRVTAGAFPAGLDLTAADGTLNGVPSGIGATTATVELAITHAGVTFVTAPISTTIRSEEAPLVLSYGTCCTSTVGDAASVVPTTTHVSVPGSSSLFESVGSMPTGISLDSTSGRLSGTLTLGGTYSVSIRQTVSLSGVRLADTVATFVWRVSGLSVQYPEINIAVFPQTPFSIAPVITGLIPGDTYIVSVEPYPGSNATGNTQSGTLIPPWLTIDPVTGVISGIGPVTAPTFYDWDVNVVLTVHRNGQDFRATKLFGVLLR